MYYVSRIAGAFALAALGVVVWFSIVLARADYYFRGGNAQRATEIAPRNTEYLALRALQLDYDGLDTRPLTQRIAALNPTSSAPRIRLGLAAEVAGDSADAERWLLDAAQVDGQFEPRWTLANFYFRAGNKAEFGKWMRAALEVSYGDRTPAYELCWKVSTDGWEIFRLAIPDRHDVVASYLVYVMQKRPDITPGVSLGIARKLAAFHDPSDLPLLLGVCDEMIRVRDRAAQELWTLAGQHVPSGIFNGDFSTEPLGHGFDWRPIEARGITHVNLNGSHRIVLSGQQEESAVLLTQALNLATGKRYRFQWEARTSGIKLPSGLEWSVGGQRSALVPSQDWAPGELTIDATGNFQPLELSYRRPMGESRAEGNVELRHIRVAEVAP